jgi:hypothetical protein
MTALANLIPNKPPMPGKCDQNWTTTKCPKIAVATSAADTQAEGDNSFSNDTQGMGYKTMFLTFGLAPQHLSVHRDNYKIHSNASTLEGKNNL